jgi:hypothetical protein
MSHHQSPVHILSKRRVSPPASQYTFSGAYAVTSRKSGLPSSSWTHSIGLRSQSSRISVLLLPSSSVMSPSTVSLRSCHCGPLGRHSSYRQLYTNCHGLLGKPVHNCHQAADRMMVSICSRASQRFPARITPPSAARVLPAFPFRSPPFLPGLGM